MEKEEKEKNRQKFKNNKGVKIIVILLIIAIFVIIGNKAIHMKKTELEITTQSSLEKVMEISNLSTIEYTYNAIVTKDGEYHVSYEGIVKAGIDFNEIEIEVDYTNKKVILTLPEVKIHETTIDMGTLDYIFTGKNKESDSISQEAYKLCKQDLKERVSKEEELLKNARENAESVITALIKPWVESIDKEFEIEYK